ncbi:hypothetical protein [Marinicella sp. W31]|uniref:hypothetical protein n=1 Tax=Marinicella sp. W31 TaxID=3023713 RepID=UPI0037578ACB
MKMKSLIGATGLVFALGFALTAQADESQTDDRKHLEVKPTAAEQNAINQSDEGLVVQRNADGSEMVDLQGRFQMYSKVLMVDGKAYYTCNTHPGLHQKMHAHMPSPKPVERAVK